MIQKANILACAASIPMGNVPVIFADASNPPSAATANAFQNGCQMVREATGSYVVLVDEQQQTPYNMALPIVTLASPVGDITIRRMLAVPVLVDSAAGPAHNQSAWLVQTIDPTSGTLTDFSGQISFAILAIGDPGGTGI